MKKRVLGLLLVSLMVLGAGCTTASPTDAPAPTDAPTASTQSLYTNENKIPYGDIEIDGAAGVERDADIQGSKWYPHFDFYNMKSDATLTILENFKTIQQSTEWTCGLTSSLMVLEYLGQRNDLTEMDLVALRQNDKPGATTLRQMINVFEALGGFDITSTFDMEEDEEIAESMILDYLKAGTPVIIGWEEWGGHWQVIIGYDTMGTDTTADDVLILADPYDTTDHDQDGYVIQSFERLYYNWHNSFDPDFDRNAFLVVTAQG